MWLLDMYAAFSTHLKLNQEEDEWINECTFTCGSTRAVERDPACMVDAARWTEVVVLLW